MSPLGTEALGILSMRHANDKERERCGFNNHAPGFVPGQGYTQEDWDEVCDTPEITDEQVTQSVPLVEAMPELIEAMRRRRGNPRTATKILVSLRLDIELVQALRNSGEGWQTRVNDILRRALLPTP